jgi:hypothetical protein
MASFPLWAATRTVRSRIGTWVGFEQYAALDPSITRESWATAIGQARAALANRVGELSRPLNRRPTGLGEMTPYNSRTARGFMQYIDVFVRDRETGVITAMPWAIRTDTLMSRQAAINQGLARFEAATLPGGTFAGEVIVGAAYGGTVYFQPSE